MKDGAPAEGFAGLENGGVLVFARSPLTPSTFNRLAWSDAVVTIAGLLAPPEAPLVSLVLPGSAMPGVELTRPGLPGLPLLLGPAPPLCAVIVGRLLPLLPPLPPATAGVVRRIPLAEEPGLRFSAAPTPTPETCFAAPACIPAVVAFGFMAPLNGPPVLFPLPIRALPEPNEPRGFRETGGPIFAVDAALPATLFSEFVARCWEDNGL